MRRPRQNATGFPLVYELDADMKPIRHYYLWDAGRVRKTMQSKTHQLLLKKQLEAIF